MAITTSRYAIFAGYNLNTVPGLSVYAISPAGGANRDLNLFQIARSSGRKLSSALYDSNTIDVSIYVTANSFEALEAALDTLYTNLQTTEGALVIPRSGGTARSYTCTYAGTTTNYFGNYADLTLTFECSDSFGYDQFYTPILNLSGLTGNPNQWNYTQGGSVDTQVPVISIYYTAGTLGLGTVIVGNQNTGQAVSVTRTWAVGETLVINSQNNTVQVNGTDVSFTGAIPSFGLGLQTIYYLDNFTSRTYQFFAYVYNRYF